MLDPDEDDGSGQVDLGWSAYLTVYSHEPNTDVNGNPRIYLNDPDIDTLANNLTPVLGQDMANYIVAYRLYGAAPRRRPATAAAAATPAPGRPAGRAPAMTPYKALSGNDADTGQTTLQIGPRARATSNNGQQTKQLKQISSVFDLVNSSVNIPNGTGPNAKTISLPSPLNDPGQLPTLVAAGAGRDDHDDEHRPGASDQHQHGVGDGAASPGVGPVRLLTVRRRCERHGAAAPPALRRTRRRKSPTKTFR